MNKYIFYFKYENEDRHLHFPIGAEKDEHAIEEARAYINYREKLGFKIENAYIEKEVKSKERVWHMAKIKHTERSKK